MRTLSLVFQLLSTLIFFSSCQKEIDWGPDIETANDSIYIRRLILLDTTLPTGSDTVHVIKYSYDGMKRLEQIVWKDLYGGVNRPDEYYTLFYTGNDTLPSRLEFSMTGAQATKFLYYSDGFVIKDSTAGSVGTENYRSVTRLTAIRNGWHELRTVSESSLNPGVLVTTDSIIFSHRYSAGNVIQETDSSWSQGAYSQTLRTQRLYDNRKNPFRRNQAWYAGYYSSIPGNLYYGNRNNIISAVDSDDFNGSVTINAEYDFNEHGYPVTGRYTGETEYKKAVFEYIRL